MSYKLRICPNCKAENSDRARRCSECSHPLKYAQIKHVSSTGESEVIDTSSRSARKTRRMKRLMWAGGFVVLALILSPLVLAIATTKDTGPESQDLTAESTPSPTPYVTSASVPDILQAINTKRTAAGIKAINLSTELTQSADKAAQTAVAAKQYPPPNGDIKSAMSSSAYKYAKYNSFSEGNIWSVDDMVKGMFADARFSAPLLDASFSDIGLAVEPYPEGGTSKNVLVFVLAAPYVPPAPVAPLYVPPPVYIPPTTHCTTYYSSVMSSASTSCY